ncbi:ribose transport system ATP-binding protein [Sporobacter termitidis DSM 10068]|uniref:Ribose transport system ATP-binding protein n=1 Tax=Sporobacter termitidis DSM 10068 TaxID=1123282 RepID=A0A1M5YZY1_9FIRM|nr:sugar ABC transporter ATP-binding protein [Sporobacter termitidis]SHI17561.1 ribose transport system ATP-binding protein [Sporobacter termitidis DSM 10068]
MNAETILEIKNLNKYFGPTHANRNISFSVKKGEIKGLIGENGSGKSTLISQIAGLYPRDSGEMLLDGRDYCPRSPTDANCRGISMVMQELGVVGSLPAGVNVFLGRTGQFTKNGVVSLKALNKAAAEQFEKWNLPKVPLNKLTDGMMIETRKMIELARALSVDPQLLLLDEITQSLSMNNRTKLYELIKKLKSMGRSVIVITHDVEELIRITDSITVLRDGEVVGDVASAGTTPEEIKRMMVGREISGDYYRADMKPDYKDDVVLSVSDLTVPGEIEDVSFDVHEGEILGFCGLSDSGIHSVGKAVFGLLKPSRGAVRLAAEGVDIKKSTGALRSNMAYVPKDRDNEALMIHASIFDNFTLPSLTELQGGAGYLSPKKLKQLAADMTKKLSVKCTDIYQAMDALSGGNKQKVNLGRWLAKDLRLLVLDCPTRGVDVGVKAYIYALMKETKAKGIATILISDELTEVLGMADRLIVMKDGRVTGTIRRDEDFTEQSVIGVMI